MTTTEIASKAVPLNRTKLLLLKDRLVLLKDNFCLHFCFLFLLVLFLQGLPVPSGNEYNYLLRITKQWHPEYLLNDWTFSALDSAHAVFNFLFGALTFLFPLKIVGWLGRISCWSLSLIALLRLGKKFRIPLYAITLSISLWLLYGQSPVGVTWIIGGFESKCVAYILLLFSLNGFINNRDALSSVLLGLSFSFHPGVGLWGALGVGLSLLFLRYRHDRLFKIAGITFLFALPGLIPALSLLLKFELVSSEDLRFFALVRIPHHLDPFSWKKSRLILPHLLFFFNWLHFRQNRENRALKFLIAFQGSICIFFSLGILARFFEYYEFLKYGPFRLFTVLILPFFFFHLMHAYHHQSAVKLSKPTLAVGFLALLTLWNPLPHLLGSAQLEYTRWTEKSDDLQKAYIWISENTPNGSIIIAPPWRKETFYISKRALIANWHMPRPDRLGEWRSRIEALGAKFEYGHSCEKNERMKYNYNNLSRQDIEGIISKYGGDYLIHESKYEYPLSQKFGTYKIYSLTRPAAKLED